MVPPIQTLSALGKHWPSLLAAPMSQEDEFFGREGSRLGAGVEVLVLVRLVTSAGCNSTTGQTRCLIWYQAHYVIIIFTQSTERARFLIRDACAAPQTHLTDYHLKLRRGKMIIGGCGLSAGSVSNQPTSFK